MAKKLREIVKKRDWHYNADKDTGERYVEIHNEKGFHRWAKGNGWKDGHHLLRTVGLDDNDFHSKIKDRRITIVHDAIHWHPDDEPEF